MQKVNPIGPFVFTLLINVHTNNTTPYNILILVLVPRPSACCAITLQIKL